MSFVTRRPKAAQPGGHSTSLARSAPHFGRQARGSCPPGQVIAPPEPARPSRRRCRRASRGRLRAWRSRGSEASRVSDYFAGGTEHPGSRSAVWRSSRTLRSRAAAWSIPDRGSHSSQTGRYPRDRRRSQGRPHLCSALLCQIGTACRASRGLAGHGQQGWSDHLPDAKARHRRRRVTCHRREAHLPEGRCAEGPTRSANGAWRRQRTCRQLSSSNLHVSRGGRA